MGRRGQAAPDAVAKAGRAALARALVDAHGARVNVQAARVGFTALHLAAYEGHAAVVRALMERGADPTLVNKFGDTALRLAATRGKVAVVDIIREMWNPQR